MFYLTCLCNDNNYGFISLVFVIIIIMFYLTCLCNDNNYVLYLTCLCNDNNYVLSHLSL